MSLSTKFADMPVGTLNGCLRFAQSHDWGQNAKYNAETGRIENCITYFYQTDFETGKEHLAESIADFANLREMRDWAGY